MKSESLKGKYKYNYITLSPFINEFSVYITKRNTNTNVASFLRFDIFFNCIWYTFITMMTGNKILAYSIT